MSSKQLSKEDIYEVILKSIKQVLNQTRSGEGLESLSRVTMETNIAEDIGLDSVEMLDLLSLLEVELKITLEADKIGLKADIKDVVEFISKKLDKG